MLLKDKPRIRSFHTKSKDGCDRCRKRRVKCDVQKPVCGGCAKFGYTCAYKPIVAKTAMTLLDKDELRCLAFYREQTSIDLRGFFDGDFWTRGILRLSYESKTMERFVLALSSLDEAYRLRAQPENIELAVSRYAFSLRQYQEAIQGLVQEVTEKDTLVTVLASCLVCICIELWHGDNLMARRHAIAGLKVAQSLSYAATNKRNDYESNVLVSRQLLPALWRHCAQMGVKTNKSARPILRTGQLEYGDPALTTDSASFDEARLRFLRLVDLVATEAENSQPGRDTSNVVQRLTGQFVQWYDQVKRLSQSSNTAKPDREECLLSILYYQAIAQLGALVTKDSSYYDSQADAFSMIVKRCKQFLEHDEVLKFQNGSRRANDGVTISALFLVVWKCSDPDIRWDALRLLYRSRRLEGLYSSSMVGVMAEGLFKIEEARYEDVNRYQSPPERIIMTGFHYDPGALEKTQLDWSCWKDNPPSISISYIDPSDPPCVSREIAIPLKPYPSAAGFGMKSVFWWPDDDRFTIMNEEIPENTKCLDGPHLGFVPFKGIVNKDVPNQLCMRWFTLEINQL